MKSFVVQNENIEPIHNKRRMKLPVMAVNLIEKVIAIGLF
jgi:hypothetical protein